MANKTDCMSAISKRVSEGPTGSLQCHAIPHDGPIRGDLPVSVFHLGVSTPS
ncbi:hypothetical protein RESH_00672 [Rhodopirellula europaea SH398]|uniref:Uncharacterized protein n=1 Tax=Rhodopirellula europaea SH398 TaxID=1263868 RepID=M5SAU8_9BACT|nr:hypothetical protein RESH_00672 [Rhodopirellula europaea SH398]